jgi:ABC-2 type transport system ATP-binding protein
MRRRLDLAMTLVGDPRIIFLDEPTAGLDPRSRRAAWQIVRELVADGVTIFLTTQYLEEADRPAGRIALVDGGRVVAEGTAAELKRRIADQRLDLVLTDTTTYDEAARLLGERVVHRDPAALTLGVVTGGSAAHVRALLDEVDPQRLTVRTFTVHTATLDDVFLALTGRHAARPEPETTDA